MKIKRLLLHPSVFFISIIIRLNSALAGNSVPTLGSKLLPQSGAIPGCTIAAGPHYYTPRNLYDYINGSADLFNAYGFVSLVGMNYSCGPESKDAVTIDIYDMGEKLNAFGVFQVNRDKESPSLNIGAGSYGADDYLVFYKDRFYIEVQGFITNQIWKTAPLKVAKIVAEQIPGDISVPRELSYFPEKGRIDSSEKYIRGGILGHAFLDPGLVCEYRNGDEIVSAFVAVLPSREDAVKSFEQYRNFLKKAGKNGVPLNGIGEQGLVSQEPYHRNIVVVQKETFIVGVYDLARVKEGIELLKHILKRIKLAR